jgi:hypothetical protein
MIELNNKVFPPAPPRLGVRILSFVLRLCTWCFAFVSWCLGGEISSNAPSDSYGMIDTDRMQKLASKDGRGIQPTIANGKRD